MKKITDLTNQCIKFTHSRSEQAINIFKNRGRNQCYSDLGMVRRPKLSLGNGCVREYIVMHELLHALGF